jgi:hypothetical protein
LVQRGTAGLLPCLREIRAPPSRVHSHKMTAVATTTSARARTITRIIFVASGILAILAVPMPSLLPSLEEWLAETVFAVTVPCLIASAGYLWLSRGERIEGWRLLALIAFTSIAVVVSIVVWVCATGGPIGID